MPPKTTDLYEALFAELKPYFANTLFTLDYVVDKLQSKFDIKLKETPKQRAIRLVKEALSNTSKDYPFVYVNRSTLEALISE